MASKHKLLKTAVRSKCVWGNNEQYNSSFVSETMRLTIAVLAIIASVVMAEKYAMVFGTADGWYNYSITSVILFITPT